MFSLVLFAFQPSLAGVGVFDDVTEGSGVVHQIISPVNEVTGGTGIAIADLNGDGVLDLVLGADDGPIRLFNGLGGFIFVEATPPAWAAASAHNVSSLALADFDNDGDDDIAVSHWDAPPRLWRRDGDIWVDATSAVGIVEPVALGSGMAWCDIDADGWLDLAVGRYAYEESLGTTVLYRNVAGQLVDVSEERGFLVEPPQGLGEFGYGANFAIVCEDFDNDGDHDILVVNDRPLIGPARYWVNDGNGYFVDHADDTGFDIDVCGMGAGIADFNADGRWDVYITNTAEGHRHLMSSCSAWTDGAAATDAPLYAWGWGVVAEDLDQDQWVDLFVTHQQGIFPPFGENSLLMAQGDGTFLDLAGDSAAIGPADSFSTNAAAGDLDGDGDLDLVVNHVTHPTQLLRNESPTGNYLIVDLEGTTSNRSGIGARVEALVDGKLLIRGIRSTSGFYSTNPLVAHFGLGFADSVDRLTVRWPSGVVQTLNDVPANQTVNLVEAPAGYAPALGAELCGDGVDNDCDGQTDPPGLGLACSLGQGVCASEGVAACSPDEVSLTCDAAPSEPALAEVCGNGLDDDCDGEVDEGSQAPCIAGQGACAVEGQLICAGGLEVCDATPLPAAPSDPCGDGVDDDCDGLVDGGAGEPCEIGLGICKATGSLVCMPDGVSVECSAPALAPPLPVELCGNGLDDDCDGVTDPGLGEPCSVGVGACTRQGFGVCASSGIGVVCSAEPGAPAPEICDNGIDDNCDGTTDEGSGDPCSVGLGACSAAGLLVCKEGTLLCDAVAGAPAPERCDDGVDNDCDGAVDEGLGEECEVPIGTCSAAGILTCGVDSFTLGCTPLPSELPTPELCGDSVDNDCDGETDEGSGEPCTAGAGACARDGVMVCAEGAPTCSVSAGAPVDENCADGIDNDCDGATDEGVDLPCQVGVGACLSVGATFCAADGTSIECDAVPSAPADERCGDAVDNDCDGEVDEDFPSVGSVCTEVEGVCVRVGLWSCASDFEVECAHEWTYGDEPERCGDGLDNDCDGETDEADASPGAPCDTAGGEPGTLTCDLTSGDVICLADPPLAPQPDPDPDPVLPEPPAPVSAAGGGCASIGSTRAGGLWLVVLGGLLFLVLTTRFRRGGFARCPPCRRSPPVRGAPGPSVRARRQRRPR